MATVRKSGRKSVSRQRKTKQPTKKRKNVIIDQTKLDAAREVTGCATETETIEYALDALLYKQRILDGIDYMAGRGGISSVEDDEFPPTWTDEE